MAMLQRGSKSRLRLCRQLTGGRCPGEEPRCETSPQDSHSLGGLLFLGLPHGQLLAFPPYLLEISSIMFSNPHEQASRTPVWRTIVKVNV